MSNEWRAWVWREVCRHGAAWTPIYLAGDDVLRGNQGAYHRKKIWLNEHLVGRSDPKAIEVIHHETFHLKIARARHMGVGLAGLTIKEAIALAGQVSDSAFRPGARADLVDHYRCTAEQDSEEECLVQMCCAVMLGEAVELPPQLRSFSKALCAPFIQRWQFWDGFAFTIWHARHGVRQWPEGKPLPGPELARAPNLSGKY